MAYHKFVRAIRDDNVMKTTSCLLKAIMCDVEQLIDEYAHHPQLDQVLGGLHPSPQTYCPSEYIGLSFSISRFPLNSLKKMCGINPSTH